MFMVAGFLTMYMLQTQFPPICSKQSGWTSETDEGEGEMLQN